MNGDERIDALEKRVEVLQEILKQMALANSVCLSYIHAQELGGKAPILPRKKLEKIERLADVLERMAE